MFGATLLGLPLAVHRGVWREMPHTVRVGTYFAALGLGFLFLEIALIQRLTLFLGYPTYSLSVTLFSILLSTGAGSLACARHAGAVPRALLILLGALSGLIVLYLIALGPLLTYAGGLAFEARVVLAVAVVAPLGFCLGWFMPLGIRYVTALTPHGDRFVAWCWAVNGFFSVVSSVLATMVAMAAGFGWVMVAAGLVYAVGIFALLTVSLPMDPATPAVSREA